MSDPSIEDDDFGDGWCIDCGDAFHLDDSGGYNPPCVCGAHCRSCHDAAERPDEAVDDGFWDDVSANTNGDIER